MSRAMNSDGKQKAGNGRCPSGRNSQRLRKYSVSRSAAYAAKISANFGGMVVAICTVWQYPKRLLSYSTTSRCVAMAAPAATCTA